MSKASEITTQLIAQLELIKKSAGYNTDIMGVYPYSDIVPDSASMPCILVNVDTDSCTGMAMTDATRERSFDIQVVFKRGATMSDMDSAHVDVLRSVGFGQCEDRKMKGLLTEQQDATFAFAQDGSKYTSVTISVTFVYIENYA